MNVLCEERCKKRKEERGKKKETSARIVYYHQKLIMIVVLIWNEINFDLNRCKKRRLKVQFITESGRVIRTSIMFKSLSKFTRGEYGLRSSSNT